MLGQLQQEHKEWASRNFGDTFTLENQILGAVEELGEICHHLLKMKQGIRGDKVYHAVEIADGIADVVIFLAGAATQLDLNYEMLVQGTWDKVKSRDWVNHPETGA